MGAMSISGLLPVGRGCKAATWNQAWCGAQLIGAQIHTCADTPPPVSSVRRDAAACCWQLMPA